MTRRTVDITVDAYDAPALIELAKRRAHQRALGHADHTLRISSIRQAWGITAHGETCDAAEIKDMRDSQDRYGDGAEVMTILMGEVAEVLEAGGSISLRYEFLDIAAVCLRAVSRLDAKGGA